MKESNPLEVPKLLKPLVLRIEKLELTICCARIYNPLYHNVPAHKFVSRPHVCISAIVVVTSAVRPAFLAPLLRDTGMVFLVPLGLGGATRLVLAIELGVGSF